MDKITIKHYLNKKLKPFIYKGSMGYPVYVRVSFGRTNYRFKSQWITQEWSEMDFNANSDIKALVKYEADIINDILTTVNNKDEINLKVIVGNYLTSIPDYYIGYVIGKDTIFDQVIKFIYTKTGLSKFNINPYVHTEQSSKGWLELIEKNAFSGETKDLMIYYLMLLEFSEKNYRRKKDWNFILEVGQIFNLYEWKRKNGKEKFLKYAAKRDMLPSHKLDEMTQSVEDKLTAAYMSDFFENKSERISIY